MIPDSHIQRMVPMGPSLSQDPHFHRIAEQVAGGGRSERQQVAVDDRSRRRISSFVRSTAIPQWLAHSATQWLRARDRLNC